MGRTIYPAPILQTSTIVFMGITKTEHNQLKHSTMQKDRQGTGAKNNRALQDGQQDTGRVAWLIFREVYACYQRSKYPNVPAYALPPFDYSDRSANALTKSVVDYITMSGGHANRVQSQGQYDPRTRRFRTGTTRKGTSDVLAVWKGRSIHIEVKYGRDKQSEAQKKYQQDVERAGGTYIIVTSFPQFYQLWKEITVNT